MPRLPLLAGTFLLACRPPAEPTPPEPAPPPAPPAARAEPTPAAPAPAAPAPIEPTPPAEPGTRIGILDKQDIRDVVRRNIADVGACYRTGQARIPNLAGRVVIEFTIGPDGVITRSVVTTSTLPDNAHTVATCIATVANRWRFPPPIGGGSVVVTYPFVLEPGRLSPSVLAPGGQQVGVWFRVTGHPANTLVLEVRDATSKQSIPGVPVALALQTRDHGDERRTAVTDARGLAVFSDLPAAGHAFAELPGTDTRSASRVLDGTQTMATVLLREAAAPAR